MSKKKNQTLHCGTITAEQQFKQQTREIFAQPPACRSGVHGDTKYNRRKTKQETEILLREWL